MNTHSNSDVGRLDLCAHTGGEPLSNFPLGNTPYVEYAQMDKLVSLQRMRTAAKTEPSFIIVSQLKELLFKLLHAELTTVRSEIAGDDVAAAVWTTRRVHRVQHLLLACWEPLSALTPGEFAQLRNVLGTASGVQSFTYRRLEFLLGNKDPAMVTPHRRTAQYEEVLDQLRQPSVYDETLRMLKRRGFDVPDAVLERDLTTPYVPDSGVEAVWRTIYLTQARYVRLHELAEALTEISYLFARWRSTHLLTVRRLIGDKPGSGGTAGVSWLRRINEHVFFPELWSVRSTL